MSTAAGAAAAAAAAQRLLEQQEEEEMTTYGPGDLAGDWEFKILRSGTAGFRNPERLRAVLDEERRGGWVLVEKFDDARIRLKRPAGTKAIAGDFADGYDPYRTNLGLGPEERRRMLLVFGGLIAFFICLIAMVVLAGR